MNDMPVFGPEEIGTKTALEDLAIETGTPIEVLFAAGEQAGAKTADDFLKIARQRGQEWGPRFKSGEDRNALVSEIFGEEAGRSFGDYATEIRAQLYGTPTVAQANQDKLDNEGFLDTAKRRGQQFVRGATEPFAALPEAKAIAQAQTDGKNVAAADIEGFDAGQRMRDNVENTFGAPNPEDRSFWGMVAEGAGNLVGMGGASLAAGVAGTAVAGPVGGVVAGMGTGGAIGAAMNTSQLYREARDMGADEATAEAAARWGAVIGASEIIPIARAFKFLPQGVRQKVGNGVMKRFVDIAQSAGEEAAQEYIAQVANNMVAQQLYDPDRGWTEGATESALVGAVLGAGAGAIGAGVDEYTSRKPQPLPDAGAGAGAVPPGAGAQPGMVPPVAVPPSEREREVPSPMGGALKPQAPAAPGAKPTPSPMSDAAGVGPQSALGGLKTDQPVQIQITDPLTGEVSDSLFGTFVGEDVAGGYASFRAEDGTPMEVDLDEVRSGMVSVAPVIQPQAAPPAQTPAEAPVQAPAAAAQPIPNLPPIPQGADPDAFMERVAIRQADGMSQQDAYLMTLQDTLDGIERDVGGLADAEAEKQRRAREEQSRLDAAVFTDDRGQPVIYPSEAVAKARLGAGYTVERFGSGFIGVRQEGTENDQPTPLGGDGVSGATGGGIPAGGGATGTDLRGNDGSGAEQGAPAGGGDLQGASGNDLAANPDPALTKPLSASDVALEAARIRRRESEASQNPQVDPVAKQEQYLRNLARDNPDQAALIAKEMRDMPQAAADAAGVSVDRVGAYASIIERALALGKPAPAPTGDSASSVSFGTRQGLEVQGQGALAEIDFQDFEFPELREWSGKPPEAQEFRRMVTVGGRKVPVVGIVKGAKDAFGRAGFEGVAFLVGPDGVEAALERARAAMLPAQPDQETVKKNDVPEQPVTGNVEGNAETSQETDPMRLAVKTGIEAGPVSHVTRAGKTLDGFVIKGFKPADVKAFDAGAFAKDGGTFIRKDRAEAFMAQAAPKGIDAPAPTPNQDTSPDAAKAAKAAADEAARVKRVAEDEAKKARWDTAEVAINNTLPGRYKEGVPMARVEVRKITDGKFIYHNGMQLADRGFGSPNSADYDTAAEAETAAKAEIEKSARAALADRDAAQTVKNEAQAVLNWLGKPDPAPVAAPEAPTTEAPAPEAPKPVAVGDFQERWEYSLPKARHAYKTLGLDKEAAGKAWSSLPDLIGLVDAELRKRGLEERLSVYAKGEGDKAKEQAAFDAKMKILADAGFEWVKGSAGDYSRTKDGKTQLIRATTNGYVLMDEAGEKGAAVASDEAGIVALADKAPAKKGWKQIGTNAKGFPLFEDERGVRSYTEDGVRISESVGFVPGGGIEIKTDKRGKDYLTQAEWDAKQPATVADAAKDADPAPTEGQKEAGNYKLGHATWNGLDLSIENEKGGERSKKGADGETLWSVTMPAHYGYFKGTKGADGEPVDFYMGDAENSDYVMWIDQAHAETGKFDEHKIMIGFTSRGAALDAYRAGFSDGKANDRLGGFFEGDVAQLKAWLAATTDPAFDGSPVNGKMDFPFKKAKADAPKADKPKVEDPDAPQPEKLEDFGAKIGGARKHIYEAKRRLMEAMAAQDLEEMDSTFWESATLNDVMPMPDFEKLAEDGDVSIDGLFMIAAIRAAIPNKPINDWRYGWKRDVMKAHAATMDILNGNYDPVEFINKHAAYGEVFGYGSIFSGMKIKERMEENPELWADFIQPLFLRIEPAAMLDVAKYIRVGEQMEYVVEDNPDKPGWKRKRGVRTGKITVHARDVAHAPWTHTRVTDTIPQAAEMINDWSKQKKAIAAAARNDKTNFDYKFDVRKGKYGNTAFIYARAPKLTELMKFDSIDDARAFLKTEDGKAELQALADEIRGGFEERRRDNKDRKGKDWRGGKDVSAKQFMDTFGFRGGQFGNSVTAKERAAFINATYDGLMDMAAILGLPPRALSLDGKLGIAFGARGQGGKNPAAAHYEPGQVVINLTRRNGAGSLAHEWFHALDNYLAKEDGRDGDTPATPSRPNADRIRNDYMSARKRRLRYGNPRDEDSGFLPFRVYDAFRALRDEFKASGYQGRMARKDKMKSAPYWSDPIEMGARSFEAWILTHLEERAFSHDFLVNVVKNDGGALPTLQERGSIFPMFNQVMDELRSLPQFPTDATVPDYPKLEEGSELAPISRGMRFEGKDGDFAVLSFEETGDNPMVVVQMPDGKTKEMTKRDFYALRGQAAYSLTDEGRMEAAQAAVEAARAAEAKAMRDAAIAKNAELIREFRAETNPTAIGRLAIGYFRGDDGNAALFIMDAIRNRGYKVWKDGRKSMFGIKGGTHYPNVDFYIAAFAEWAQGVVEAEKARAMMDKITAEPDPVEDDGDAEYEAAFDAAFDEIFGKDGERDLPEISDDEADHLFGKGDPQPDDAVPTPEDAQDPAPEEDTVTPETAGTPEFTPEEGSAPKRPGDKVRDSAKAAKDSAEQGVRDSMKALNTLFGPKMNRLNSGFVFDEETYKAALPHFKNAYRNFASAATSLVDLARALIEYMEQKGLDAAVIGNMRPYFIRFMKDVQTKKVNPLAEDEIAVSSEITKMADAFQKALDDGTSFKTINAARRMAGEAIGRALTDADYKTVEEAMELALVRASRKIVAAGKDKGAIYDALTALYQAQPLLAQRTSDSVRRQAYSTPSPLAYLASELAGIDATTTVYEPTAGNGMLLIGADPKLVTANELDAERAARLRDALGEDATITVGSALDLDGPSEVDVVIQNPPFGKLLIQDTDTATEFDVPFGKDGKTTAIDHAIAAKTLANMADDGRAVLIVGGHQGDAAARKGKYRGAPRAFWNWVYSNYNVTEHFTVSGDLYKRQGAGWPVDVVVIEGRTASKKALPMAEVPALYEAWAQLKGRIDGTNSTLDPRGNQPDNGNDQSGAGSDADVDGVSGQADNPAGTPDRDGGDTAGGSTAGPRAGGTGGTATGASGAPVNTGTGRPTGDPDERKPDRTAGGPLERPDAPTGGSDGGGSGGVQRGGSGDVGGGKPAVAKPARVNTEEATDLQVQYDPKSSAGFAVGTLVPKNMQTAMTNALAAIEAEVGDIDQFVAKELGYDAERMLNGDGTAPGYFSAEQVDALALSIYNIKKGGGFIIGDQTGVGKGRVVAAMMRWAERNGRIPVFLTARAGLYNAMIGDMRDIGWDGDPVADSFVTNTNLRGKDALDLDSGGTLMSMTPKPYKEAMSALAAGKLPEGIKRIFTTYSQVQSVKGAETQRRAMFRTISSKALFILDESHLAGGPGKPPARVKEDEDLSRSKFIRDILDGSEGAFFSSATFAKSPSVMSLYAKTDLGMAVEDIAKLGDVIEKGGVPMQQVASNMLVEAGQYVRRERSYAGVTFNTTTYPTNMDAAGRGTAAIRSVFELDRDVMQDVREAFIENMKNEGHGSGGKDNAIGEQSLTSVNFSSIMHNVVTQFITSLKADAAADRVVEIIKSGRKPIIALSSTNEAIISDFVGDAEDGDFVGDVPFNSILVRYLDRLRRITVTDKDTDKTRHIIISDDQIAALGGAKALNQFKEARAALEAMDLTGIPGSPLDYIMDKVADAGYQMGEITGRSISVRKGIVTARFTSAAEKNRTMRAYNNGDIPALIINKSGAEGFSLHATGKGGNDGKPRSMIILQPDPDITVFMQLIGRIHRTGQIHNPEYDIAISQLAVEKRPAAVLMRKMSSLSANTTANKESVVTLQAVDFMNKYGDQVMREYLNENPEIAYLMDMESLLTKENKNDEDEREPATGGDYAAKATGRMAILDPKVAEAAFKDIEEAYLALIEELDRSGQNDLEAKTLELDAIKKSENKLTAGVAGSTSPFAAPAKFEVLNVKSMGNPMSTKEVLAAVKESWGDGDIRSWRSDMRTEIASWVEPAQAKFEPQIEAKQKQYAEAQTDKQRERMAAALDDLRTRRDGVRQKVRDLIQNLNEYAPGRPLVLIDKSDPDMRLNGVVLGVNWDRAEKNPNAPSKIMVRIAIASPEREIRRPLSSFIGDNPLYDVTFFQNLENTASMFDKVPRETREDRGMITGNLIAGYEKFPKGRIVMFTRDDGSVESGILMPRNFNLAVEMERAPVSLGSADNVLAYIGKNQAADSGYAYYAIAETTDGVVKITKNSRGTFQLTVRAKGGKKYAEHSVIKKLFGEMNKRGNAEYNQIIYDADDARAVVAAYIKDLRAEFQATTNKDWAREITGTAFPAADGQGDLLASVAKDPAARIERTAPQPMSFTERIKQIEKGNVTQLHRDLRAELKRVGIDHAITLDLRPDTIQFPGLMPMDGYFLDGVIGVAADALDGPMGILRHEIIHALRRPELWGGTHGLFTAEEWKTLVNAARRHTRLRAEIEANYPNLPESGKIEEIIAEMFREWSEARDKMDATPAVKSIMARIEAFIAAIAKALRKNGANTAADVFESIRSGEIGGRGPNGPGGGRGPVRASASKDTPRNKIGFRTDNPGGGWLESKQRDAAEAMKSAPGHSYRSKGLGGSVTGYILSPIMLPVSAVADLPGAQGERRAAGDPKFDALAADVKAQGFLPDQGGNAIVVGINHRGQAFLLEGNTRVAVAKQEGVTEIRADVRWFNGGEEAAGAFSPDAVSAIAKPDTSTTPDPRVMASVSKLWARKPATDEAALDAKERGFISNLLTDAMGGKSPDYNLLALAPGEVLFRDLGKKLPSAAKWIDTVRKMNAERNDRHAQADVLAREWQGAYAKDKKAGRAMFDLMYDATLAGQDPAQRFKVPARKPGMAADRFPAFVEGKRAEYEALKDRFKALPDHMQDLFRRVRDSYKQFDADLMDAMVDNVVKAMDLQAERLQAQYQATMQEIRDEGLTGDEKAEAETLARRRLNTGVAKLKMSRQARVRQMRLKFESARIEDPYFPLMRFGEYFVTARDESGKVVSYSRFQSEAKQKEFAAAMKAEGFTTQEGVTGPDANLERYVDPSFVADIQGMIGESGADSTLADAIWQRWLETLPDFSIRKANIHRKGTPGFDRDALRAFGNRMFHGAHQLARLRYGTDLTKYVEATRREAARADDPNRAGLIANEMAKRHEWTMNPTGSSWSAAASSAAFVWYLGLTPAAAIVNVTQTTTVGIPVLTAGIEGATVAKTSAALLRAMRDFTGGIMAKGMPLSQTRGVLTSKNLTKDERAAMEEAYRRGTVDKSQAHDIAAIGDGGIEYSPVREKIMRPIAFLFHHAERLNREVTFLAAYRMVRETGLDHDAAIDKASNLTWDTHFNYENWSRPRFMQADFARVMLTFRQFSVNMLYRLFRDAHQAFQGESPEVRKQARAHLIGITSMMLVQAGITGTWGYALIMLLAGMFFEGGGDEAEEELKSAVIGLFGAGAGGMLLKGVPGHLSGVDLSARIGMPELWFRSPNRQLEGKEAYQYWLEQLVGPVPGIAGGVFRGVDLMSDGEIWRGAEAMVPKAIRDQMRFVRYLNEGVTTYKGDPLLDSVSAHDAIVQAIGFSPARVSERYEQNRRLMNRQEGIETDRRQILADVTRYLRDGKEISPRALRSIERFNQKYPTYAITNDTIRRSLTAREKMSQQMEGGMRLNPKLDRLLREEAAPNLYD